MSKAMLWIGFSLEDIEPIPVVLTAFTIAFITLVVYLWYTPKVVARQNLQLILCLLLAYRGFSPRRCELTLFF